MSFVIFFISTKKKGGEAERLKWSKVKVIGGLNFFRKGGHRQKECDSLIVTTFMVLVSAVRGDQDQKRTDEFNTGTQRFRAD
jgi:hypothetical protein